MGQTEFQYARTLHEIPAEGAEEDPFAEATVVDEANLKIGDAIARLQKA